MSDASSTQANQSPFKKFLFNPAGQPKLEQPIFEGLLLKGDLAVWLAREKAGKSTLLLQMMICAAIGRAFLHFKYVLCRPAQVVIIDYESRDGSIHRRYKAISNALGLTEVEREMLGANLTILEVRDLRKDGQYFPPIPPNPISPHSADTQNQQKALEFWQWFVTDHPADIYCIDPLRCAHQQDENDSKMAALMISLQVLFDGQTVMSPHHMRKTKDDAPRDVSAFIEDMRQWSDRCRGSSTIKAHADVIICQARTQGDYGTPHLYFGAFGRDMDDVEPFRLEETDHESFTWRVCPEVKPHLEPSWKALREYAKPNGQLPEQKAELIKILVAGGINQKTAYRHINLLVQDGLLLEDPYRLRQEGFS